MMKSYIGRLHIVSELHSTSVSDVSISLDSITYSTGVVLSVGEPQVHCIYMYVSTYGNDTSKVNVPDAD